MIRSQRTPSPAGCFIWARCGGQKFPLFIFTPNGRVCTGTQRPRTVAKSQFYCCSLGGSLSVGFSALLGVSLGNKSVLRSPSCHCMAKSDKALRTLPLATRRSRGGQKTTIELWNNLRWKGSTRITESNSWHHTGQPQESHHVLECVVQMLFELWQD